jgi:enoyl-CoA hydratase
MSSVIYEKDGRIARVILNRPEKMNAIDEKMPKEIENAIQLADSDPDIHVIILSGAGKAFCAGYDLEHYSKESLSNNLLQDMPWDPIKDYQFMWKNTQHFMSLWRALKPVICKVHGYAVAGGSDIALCSDMTIMANNAEIGYMPSRVWGTPTTAMWVHRLGPERAKRLLFTGDKINGIEAAKLGLILESVPLKNLDQYVENLAERMASVPINQLAMQKMIINQSMESSGLMQMQRMSTIFDGISRHSPEGIEFKDRVESIGWQKAVEERDQGTYDWTKKEKL